MTAEQKRLRVKYKAIPREQVVIGETYIAKVSGKKVRVLIEGIDAYGGWWARNLETKRIVRVKDESHLTPLK